METDPARCPGCGSTMVVGFTAPAEGRRYTCDHCGSTVTAIAVAKRAWGASTANAIWSDAPEGDGTDRQVMCPFCFAAMERRQPPAGGAAAVCHTCQVVWLDEKCRYCGGAFELAPPVVVNMGRGGSPDWGSLGAVAYWIARAGAAVAGWSPWN